MHQWISLTTALEAEGNLNRNSYCSWSHSNPTDSNQWMERKRRRWSVGGDERQLEMVFLYCVDLVSFFVYGIVVDVFLWFWLFRWLLNQIDWRWIATHRLSNCKSPHHDYRGIRFLRWKDNWFWSHRIQWNISCTLWVSWIHRMGWIAASVIGIMDCKERQE